MDDELTELNYEYLRVARRLAQTDPDTAVLRLGLSRRAVDRLAQLSLDQLRHVARQRIMSVQLRGAVRAALEGAEHAPAVARYLQADLRDMRAAITA